MPLAASNVCGYAPATYGGRVIPEKAPATIKLSQDDTHFGINGSVSAIVSNSKINRFGPRAIDLQVRGGKVAESLWQEFKSNPSSMSSQLTGFLTLFDDIGSNKAPKSEDYPSGAKISGVNVAGDRKYKVGAIDKTMTNIQRGSVGGTRYQLGTRWSKVALEMTVRQRGKIHFHLDGMGDVKDILEKSGDYSHNVTSRELRYIRRNWTRRDFRESVVFYNGFKQSSGGVFQAIVVSTPWNA